MTTKTGLLRIGTYSSRCNDCGKGADPNEKMHLRVLGYGVGEDEKGCGIEWEYVTNDYLGMEQAVREMRPDLIFLPVLFTPEPEPDNAGLTFICRPCARQAYEFCDGGFCGFSADFIEGWITGLKSLATDEWDSPEQVRAYALDLLEEKTWTI